MATIEVGAAAPEFELPDQDEKPTRLEELRGQWVVLYFYPKDDTPGCTTEACEFSAGVIELEALDATVLGCSPDDPASHRRFIAKHELRIRLLSDPQHEVLERYGAWGEKTMYGRTTTGVIRSTVLIDPRGRVAHHWPNVKAAGHAAKVRQVLDVLRSRTATT
jgi:thioredoxin-dependent peroxiredoxin